jgi:hypothetical protein
MPAVMDQVRETGTLGDKPLAVVSTSDHEAEAMTDSKAKAAQFEREAQILQEELTHLSSDSTQRVVEGSTDNSIVLDRRYAWQTDEEIMRVVEAVRTGQPLTR